MDLVREIFIDVEPDVRVRYRRSESPPPWRYAVMLEALVEGNWITVRLWDNDHDPEVHHEHDGALPAAQGDGRRLILESPS